MAKSQQLFAILLHPHHLDSQNTSCIEDNRRETQQSLVHFVGVIPHANGNPRKKLAFSPSPEPSVGIHSKPPTLGKVSSH